MRIRHIVICNAFGSTVFFSHHLLKGAIFEKKVVENKMGVLIFCTTFETFLILRKYERNMIEILCWSSCDVPVILVRF